MNVFRKNLSFLVLLTVAVVLLFCIKFFAFSQEKTTQRKDGCLWEICSVDTVRTSRDRARAELNNISYDKEIREQVEAIKDSGATHVAIGTPYDTEFLPYLKRWVAIARENDLNVWFRGNWSEWEGWFDYPKGMTPQQHIDRTSQFIQANPDLFKDGDIFDACPECENSGLWPQPEKNDEYNAFIRDQEASLQDAFSKINKRVRTNIPSIIGGRAKEVLDQKTIDSLDKVVSIDHYFKNPTSITEYVDYFFDSHGAKTIVSEFGAPIPDMNGNMTEDEQANFVGDVLERLYEAGDKVEGLNYWSLSEGTTSIINLDGTKRKVFSVLQQYYMPGFVSGIVKSSLGEVMKNAIVRTSDGIMVVTDSDGKYSIPVPKRKLTLSATKEDFVHKEADVEVSRNEEKVTQNFTMEPSNPNILYKIRLFIKDRFK